MACKKRETFAQANDWRRTTTAAAAAETRKIAKQLNNVYHFNAFRTKSFQRAEETGVVCTSAAHKTPEDDERANGLGGVCLCVCVTEKRMWSSGQAECSKRSNANGYGRFEVTEACNWFMSDGRSIFLSGSFTYEWVRIADEHPLFYKLTSMNTSHWFPRNRRRMFSERFSLALSRTLFFACLRITCCCRNVSNQLLGSNRASR